VPDKRQESKQRRAARNRANREALAARRDNALAEPSPSPSRSAASSSSASASAPSTTGGSGAPAPPPSGLLGMLRSKRPGDKAVLAAAFLAILAALGMLFLVKISVDDRGEPIPPSFGGLTIAAREALGNDVPDRSVGLLDAYGPAVALYAVIPLAVVGFALWGIRRPDRSRMLTFAMLAMAGVVVLGSGVYFFPALIALLVAGFQVRKADLPARAAQPFGGRGRRGGEVIDTTATEGDAEAAGDEAVDAEPVDADLAGDEPGAGEGEPAGEGTADAEAGSAPEAAPDDAEPDPLAELEAEIEAERAAEGGRPRPDDEGGPGTTGR
jgi:hypothetical protein